MSELKPCPFCGHTDLDEHGPCTNYGVRINKGIQYFVVCCIQTHDYDTMDEAIAAWNNRPDSMNKKLDLAASLERIAYNLEKMSWAPYEARYPHDAYTTLKDQVVESIRQALKREGD